MTQAPTPGPLSASDVKLLVKGDLLRVTCDTLIGEPSLRIPKGTVVEFEVSEHGLVGVQGDFWGHSAFAFIGRPDADGWMPWSGGENPVPGQRVDFQEADGATNLVNCASEVFDVWHKPGRFRLAPTAPVEASGSEREAMKEALAELKRIPAPLTDDGDVTSWDARNEVAAGIHAAETWLERALNLRPQPSGETREAVAKCIIGPRNAVPEPSLYTLEELRQVRWNAASDAERKDALWAADAIFSALKMERAR